MHKKNPQAWEVDEEGGKLNFLTFPKLTHSISPLGKQGRKKHERIGRIKLWAKKKNMRNAII